MNKLCCKGTPPDPGTATPVGTNLPTNQVWFKTEIQPKNVTLLTALTQPSPILPGSARSVLTAPQTAQSILSPESKRSCRRLWQQGKNSAEFGIHLLHKEAPGLRQDICGVWTEQILSSDTQRLLSSPVPVLGCAVGGYQWGSPFPSPPPALLCCSAVLKNAVNSVNTKRTHLPAASSFSEAPRVKWSVAFSFHRKNRIVTGPCSEKKPNPTKQLKLKISFYLVNISQFILDFTPFFFFFLLPNHYFWIIKDESIVCSQHLSLLKAVKHLKFRL